MSRNSSDDNVTVTSDSSVPGGFGLPNVYTAEDNDTGETAKGGSEKEARDNLEDLQEK